MQKEELLTLVCVEDIRITVSDAREYFGGCIPGWKLFAELNGLDWKYVLKHGMLASELLAIDDAMVFNLINHIYEKRYG